MLYICIESDCLFENSEEDFDNKVKNLLFEKGGMPRESLIKLLIDEKKTGYSKPSIERKLSNLIEAEIIDKMDFKEAKEYGFEAKDKRTKFIVPRDLREVKEQLDWCFKNLDLTNAIELEVFLAEIESYEKVYLLKPEQIDLLLTLLKNASKETATTIIRVVYNNMTRRGIKPKDKEIFLQTLRKLLHKYKDEIDSNQFRNLRTSLIHLLGMYNDESVIEQLKYDAEKMATNDTVHNDYKLKYTAQIISKHKKELLQLEIKLFKEKKSRAAIFLRQIRFSAKKWMGFADIEDFHESMVI